MSEITAADYTFLRITKTWRLWAIGWSDFRHKLPFGGSVKVISVALGPLRFQFMDERSRWRPRAEGDE